MTEFDNSIVAHEREQAAEQQTLRAVEHLRRSGVEDADADTIETAAMVPALGKLQQLHAEYQHGIHELQDDPDASDEDRQLAYADLVEEAREKAAQIARRVREEATAHRNSLNVEIFGAGKVRAGYRDALLRANRASNEELAELSEIATMTGDVDLTRAVAAVADRRGNKQLVHRYIAADEKLFDDYAARESIPTDATLGILINAYTPQTISRDQLKPSPLAQQKRKDKERENNYRRMRAFG